MTPSVPGHVEQEVEQETVRLTLKSRREI